MVVGKESITLLSHKCTCLLCEPVIPWYALIGTYRRNIVLIEGQEADVCLHEYALNLSKVIVDCCLVTKAIIIHILEGRG